jgi:hypothetical protein
MRMMDKLAIMMSAAAIFAARAGITIPEIIPTKLPWYAVRSAVNIIIRCGCGILRRMGYAVARIIHIWQIPNRSKYSKGVVTNEA